jgi:hypothetical protein
VSACQDNNHPTAHHQQPLWQQLICQLLLLKGRLPVVLRALSSCLLQRLTLSNTHTWASQSCSRQMNPPGMHLILLLCGMHSQRAA